MRTIMIKDTVYEKLAVSKKDKSFSELLDELIEESRAAKMSRLRKYFGMISDKKAKEMSNSIKRIRKEFVINV